MKRLSSLFLVGGLLILAAALISGCEAPATLTVVPSPTPESTATPEATSPPQQEEAAIPGAAAKAVDLIAAWVEAGAPESEPFNYTGIDGNTYQGTYAEDIQPLFTQANVWFDGSPPCSSCHFANAENSYHEMDLSSHQGMMSGADALSSPPGVPILGQSEVGATDFNWDASKLKARLRNNRMPPGWEFDITEANRDGPCVNVTPDGVEVLLGEYDCELHAVDLIGAWVNAGAPETRPFNFGGDFLTFERDVLPFFTQPNMWYEGSQNCTGCHFANSENSYHEMDLSSYQGIMTGADALSEPPGVPIVVPGDWDASKLKARLRNNRMPPGVAFDITEENRDGPLVLHGERVEMPAEAAAPFGNGECQVKGVDLVGAWVDAGAPESDPFDFTDLDGNTCQGTFDADILPLFTQAGAWFEGSPPCSSCHFANSENSYHEMDLSTYQGIMTGADALSEPPGVPIITPGDFHASVLRGRLRNNRMPPGWEFDITEANRDGPCVDVSTEEGVTVHLGQYDCDLHAVDLIGAWVDAGAPETDPFEFGGAQLTFERDVLPFFTQPNMWYEGSQNCTGCHFANSENSYHEMDLSSYQGIMTGADALSEPPGVPIITPGDWSASVLRGRLRNNRMPPGVAFDITEENRDGPVILAGTKK